MNVSKAFAGSELLETWFEFSKTTTPYVNVPKLTMYTRKFIMFACKKLELSKIVFFTSVEIIDKYLDIIRHRNCDQDPAFSVVAGILIANKLVGQQLLPVRTLLDFLQEQNFGEYTVKSLLEKERAILRKIQFELPLQTIYDEMNILFDMVIEPLSLVINLRLQCVEIMKFYYLHSTMIYESLKEIYAKHPAHLQKIIANKYYIPAGVIIYAVAMNNGLNIITVNEISNKLSELLGISVSDLDVVHLTVSETVDVIMNIYED